MDIRSVKDVVILILFLLLLFGIYQILSPFLISIAWSVILALITWPLYKGLVDLLKGRRGFSAFIMCMGTLIVIIVPVLLLILYSREEVISVYKQILRFAEEGFPPERYPRIQWLLGWLKERIPGEVDVKGMLLQRAGTLSQILIGMGQKILQNLFKLGMTLFVLFFIYRDGERFLALFRELLPFPAGQKERIFTHTRDLIRSIFYGVFLTALVQGVAAGIGYFIAGFKAPVFLGLLTAFFAFIPYGATVVWISATIWLFAEGAILRGIFMGIWGMGVVSMVDNIVRPIVISSTGKVSLLLILLGSVGGIMAFGMVGLFIGPVLLSVGLALLKGLIPGEITERP